MAIVVIGDKARERYCPCQEPSPDASGRRCLRCRFPVREGIPAGAATGHEPFDATD